MKYAMLTIIISLLSLCAEARKPAVEDVFTIIPADYQVIPDEKLAPMNFTKKIPVVGKMDKQGTPANGWIAVIGLIAMLSLPGLMWYQLTQNNPSLKHEHHSDLPPQNVSRLDDYRKSDKDEDEDDQHKKAS